MASKADVDELVARIRELSDALPLGYYAIPVHHDGHLIGYHMYQRKRRSALSRAATPKVPAAEPQNFGMLPWQPVI
jgi:hypothetical protein